MKVGFFSCYLSSHQLPFSLAMRDLTGNQYAFIATEPISRMRLDFGWEDLDKKYPFVIRAYEGGALRDEADRAATECEIAIVGDGPEKYVRERVSQGKLTFRYRERMLKNGPPPFYKLPFRALLMWLEHGRHRGRPLYLLCASAYTAADYAMFGCYKDKAYKWGYFPETSTCGWDELARDKRKSAKPTILWVGRLIGCKHPEAAILLAEDLRDAGKDFRLDIIGCGVLEERMSGMIEERHLRNHVRLLGAMGQQKVCEQMEGASVFLSTSDFSEGWGAVVNEAMGAGCAVVASHAIGSVPFLIQNGQNGMIYKYGDQGELNRQGNGLLENPEERESMGRAAHATIKTEWNARAAAERFLVFADQIKAHGSCDLFQTGPLSRAEVLGDGWYRP